MFCMLMLGFSSDGIRSPQKLPQGIVVGFLLLAAGLLLYGSIAPAIHYWLDHSLSAIIWPIKIGFSGALIAMLIDFIIIVKAASG